MILILSFVLMFGAFMLFTWIFMESNNLVISISIFLLLAFLFVVAFGVNTLNERGCNIEEIEKISIYSSYNATSTEGGFVLGSGSVDEKEIVFYWVNNNGVKSKQHQLMSQSIFIEDGNRYVLLKSRVCKENMKWFYICEGFYQAEFHVPEGSIAKMYDYK